MAAYNKAVVDAAKLHISQGLKQLKWTQESAVVWIVKDVFFLEPIYDQKFKKKLADAPEFPLWFLDKQKVPFITDYLVSHATQPARE